MFSENFLRVLADLITPTTKLTEPHILDLFFSAQFSEGSKAVEFLLKAFPHLQEYDWRAYGRVAGYNDQPRIGWVACY
jgi:hypothetical protein